MLKKLIDVFYNWWDYGTFALKANNDTAKKPHLIIGFIAKHYCCIIDIVCLSIIALTFLFQGLTWWGLMFGLLVLASFSSPECIIGAVLIAAVNIAAYKMIKADKRIGMLPAVLGGIIGAYVAVKNENTDYFAVSVIKTIFRIFIRLCVWFCIYAAVSVSMYLLGYYELDLGWK